jgi:hypothetical protein
MLAGCVMEHEKDAFDVTGFLDLLGNLVRHHGTGVLSARIHVRDGMPWAACVQFDNTAEKVA